MSADQKLHQAMLNKWAILFSEQKESGLSVRQWCEQNNCSIHKYNYWKHLLKEEVSDRLLPDIAPLYTNGQISASAFSTPVSKSSSEDLNLSSTLRANRAIIRFTVNGLSFEFDSPVPESFLCSLMKAVRHV